MALRVLDGNQSATTLSSVVTGGEHIVAHSVVSLGANAISDITNAVSGSAVSVSNFPALQSTTFGAITGSASILNFPSTQTIAGTVTVGGFSSVSVGSGAILIAGDRNGSIVPIPIDSGSGQVGVQLKQSSGPSIDPISQTNGLWVRQANGSSITVGNSVTIGSLPAISGTVTANGFDFNNASYHPLPLAPFDEEPGGGKAVVAKLIDNNGSGLNFSAGVPISGTVTAAAPNGSLTTRFGTPTTANVSFATSAVTNANRKYLLIQNVTTGSNVITVGIGFTPTTTQGIQLTAGGGITFESSYIPTGAVYVLSSVTASNFTILEA